ncbi:hypothetical protein HH310_02400 [Actinoplanes sp. TBRC 11911]|uniref:hypothetical protein n=1 Tax=Actinoplanes sp. TBRC 11911 TaxID=2729386 RepID=UPI00145DDDC4|nr:hypothetical protein [Actinoplanes sp. TBRC 11911]NMO50047.1 hypothetical protein [Actinoplanes sp. TBRC 11911]
MTTDQLARTPTKHFGRDLGLGVLVQAIAFGLAFGIVALTSLGDDDIVGSVFFLLFIPALDVLALIVEVILVVIPATRARLSGPGLLLGWLIGLILQVAAIVVPIIVINT